MSYLSVSRFVCLCESNTVQCRYVINIASFSKKNDKADIVYTPQVRLLSIAVRNATSKSARGRRHWICCTQKACYSATALLESLQSRKEIIALSRWHRASSSQVKFWKSFTEWPWEEIQRKVDFIATKWMNKRRRIQWWLLVMVHHHNTNEKQKKKILFLSHSAYTGSRQSYLPAVFWRTPPTIVCSVVNFHILTLLCVAFGLYSIFSRLDSTVDLLSFSCMHICFETDVALGVK